MVSPQLSLLIINDVKASYYRDKISTCTDQKYIFKIVEQLPHQQVKSKLPSHNSKAELAEKFNSSFPKSPKYAKNSILLLMLA